MITGLTPANNQFVNSLNNLENAFTTADNQLASGYRVNQASDAPQEVTDIFQARANIGQVNQITQNLTTVQSQVNSADSAIQTAVQLFDQAISIGTQGASSTTTPQQMQSLATQVQSLESELVGLSNTQVDGVYIFSGDQSNLPSYQVDTSSPTGVDQLISPQATQQIEDPTGVTFQAALTAQQIFDAQDSSGNPLPGNAFAALNSLNLALQSGDTSSVSQALSSVQTASGYLNQQLGFYGAVENRITTSLNLAQTYQTQDQTELGNLEDTNVTSASLALTQTSTDIDAAMAAEAKQPTTTLFDYLPYSS